jgi:hypothetical protein
MRVPVDLDARADLEHFLGPAGSLQQRGRAHLAAHVQLLALGIDRVDLHVGVRIDEVHLGEGSGQVQRQVHLELAEAVVRRRWHGDAKHYSTEKSRLHDSV